MKLVFAFFILIAARTVFAYPEMIRHGYVSCRTCHASVHGGDLLTDYGKSLSQELLSQNPWPKAADAEDDMGTKKWWTLGSHARLLQTHVENSQVKKGRFLVMQLDVDGMASINKKWQLYYSFGRFEPTQAQSTAQDFVYTPRAWAAYNFDKAWQIRSGRFFPAYGILLAEHTYAVRRYLTFNPGSENFISEISYDSDKWSLIAQKISGRFNYNQQLKEDGFALQASHISDGNRLGLNIYQSHGENSGVTTKNDFLGVFGVFTLDEKNSLLAEVDRIKNSDGTQGLVNLIKWDHIYQQGLHFFLTQEYYNSVVDRSEPHYEAYGAGTQYYPYRGLDFQAIFRKEKNTATLSEFQSVVWLILHAYY